MRLYPPACACTIASRAQTIGVVLYAALILTSGAPAAASALPGCRPGTFLKPGVELCVECEAGVDFTAEYNREEACTTCTTCTGGRHSKSDCTVTQNTVCGCRDNEYEHADGCSPKQGHLPDAQTLNVGIQLRRQESKLDNLTLTLLELKNHLELSALTKWLHTADQLDLGDRLPPPANANTQLILTVVNLVLLATLVALLVFLNRHRLKEAIAQFRTQRCQSTQRGPDSESKAQQRQQNDPERSSIETTENGASERRDEGQARQGTEQPKAKEQNTSSTDSTLHGEQAPLLAERGDPAVKVIDLHKAKQDKKARQQPPMPPVRTPEIDRRDQFSCQPLLGGE